MLFTSPLPPQIPVFQEGFILLGLPISPLLLFCLLIWPHLKNKSYSLPSRVIPTKILPKLLPSICTLVTLEGPFDSVLLPLCLNALLSVFLNGHSSQLKASLPVSIGGLNLRRVTLLQLIMPPLIIIIIIIIIITNFTTWNTERTTNIIMK